MPFLRSVCPKMGGLTVMADTIRSRLFRNVSRFDTDPQKVYLDTRYVSNISILCTTGLRGPMNFFISLIPLQLKKNQPPGRRKNGLPPQFELFSLSNSVAR